MNLRHKQILITAGPTWVALDSVRVISNVASGQTGILLANKLKRAGARVTLFLGPVSTVGLNPKVKVVNFRFFDELRNRLKKELKKENYDIIIHSAAVSDFRPQNVVNGKFISGRVYNLKLIPLPKIIKEIKTLNPLAMLVMFKLEAAVSDKTLIQRAISSRNKMKAQIIVANRISPYRAFIINEENEIISADNRKDLVRRLINLLKVN